MSDARLKSFIDRVLRLKEEQDTLASDIREVYAEAKGEGYDKTAMGQLVGYLRKKEKDGDKLEEQSAKFDLYLQAYERSSHTYAGARTREEATAGERLIAAAREIVARKMATTPHNPATGEVIEPQGERDEPAAAAEVAGDYLREPVAAEQGQIVREGDAPRETDCQAGEASQGGSDASCPDTESQSNVRDTTRPPRNPPAPDGRRGSALTRTSPDRRKQQDNRVKIRPSPKSERVRGQ